MILRVRPIRLGGVGDKDAVMWPAGSSSPICQAAVAGQQDAISLPPLLVLDFHAGAFDLAQQGVAFFHCAVSEQPLCGVVARIFAHSLASRFRVHPAGKGTRLCQK